jgi:hypothetical protein
MLLFTCRRRVVDLACQQASGGDVVELEGVG